jgi:hypothetical protein
MRDANPALAAAHAHVTQHHGTKPISRGKVESGWLKTALYLAQRVRESGLARVAYDDESRLVELGKRAGFKMEKQKIAMDDDEFWSLWHVLEVKGATAHVMHRSHDLDDVSVAISSGPVYVEVSYQDVPHIDIRNGSSVNNSEVVKLVHAMEDGLGGGRTPAHELRIDRFTDKKAAAMAIQARWRGIRGRKAARAYRDGRAAEKIQSTWRGIQTRRAVWAPNGPGGQATIKRLQAGHY